MKFGIYTLIIESHLRVRLPGFGKFDFGWGNGYVLIPHNHPFYGVNYDELALDAHGGLTYGEKFKETRFLEWVECREIDGDITRENFEKFQNYWMIGFDTAHSGDNLDDCSKVYVMNETNNLLEQCLDDNIKGMKKYKSVYLRKDKLKKINASVV